EAHTDSREAEDDARERRAEDARRVEEARVERDRVRKRLPAHHPVRQLLARRHVEHQNEPVQERDRVQHPRFRNAADRNQRERNRGDELADLRPDHEPSRVEPIREHPRKEPEERKRQELRERHDPHGERIAVRELEDEPAERDPLHPRAGLRDRLAREEESVIAVAQAREGAPQRRSSTSRESGSTAASTAASSSGVRPPSLAASQAVRRERTRRSTRCPSSVSVRPTRRRSSALGVRSTSPSRSSRSTWFDMAGAETRPRAASSPPAIPGADLL